MVVSHRADTLYEKNIEMKNFLLFLCTAAEGKNKIEHLYKLTHSTEMTDKTWMNAMFEHSSVSISLTLLTKFESDCVTGEGVVLESMAARLMP
jgi:hypothetical protein